MSKKIIVVNLAVAFVFLLDRFLKNFFIQNPQHSGDFIVGIVSWRFVQNYGISFGWFSNRQVIFQYLFILVAAMLIIGILNFLILAYRKRENISIFFLTLILAGAISNFIDRVWYGYVVDYLDISFFTVLNLSDIMITVGIVAFFVNEIYHQPKEKSV